MSVITSMHNGYTLTFDEGRHRYSLDGKPLVGTTTFIKGGYPTPVALTSWMMKQSAEYVYDALKAGSTLTKLEIVKAAKGKPQQSATEAADIGTHIHDYAFYHQTGQDAKLAEVKAKIAEHVDRDKIDNGLRAYHKWADVNTDEILDCESIVASVTHQFGGKFDTLRRRNGKVILSDYKTSNGLYVEQYLQEAAYMLAIEEWKERKIDGLEILRFGKDGVFEPNLIEDAKFIEQLKAQAIRCRQTYEFAQLTNKMFMRAV